MQKIVKSEKDEQIRKVMSQTKTDFSNLQGGFLKEKCKFQRLEEDFGNQISCNDRDREREK